MPHARGSRGFVGPRPVTCSVGAGGSPSEVCSADCPLQRASDRALSEDLVAFGRSMRRDLAVTYTQAFGDIVHELRSHIGAIRTPVINPAPATEGK